MPTTRTGAIRTLPRQASRARRRNAHTTAATRTSARAVSPRRPSRSKSQPSASGPRKLAIAKGSRYNPVAAASTS